jgi:hypothetical protein
MEPLKHTLVSEGTTDANLIPIINWTLREAAGVVRADGIRAELWRLPRRQRSLADRIKSAMEFFPCDVLFVHRDAERYRPAVRHREIHEAVNIATNAGLRVPAVALVPVRMLEAWLLFNEDAIRNAAGNPNGTTELNLPALKRIESRPDPKGDLREALIIASELQGRRRKKFNASHALWRIVDFIEDFSPLRQLPAFGAFEDTIRCLKACEWEPGFYGPTADR